MEKNISRFKKDDFYIFVSKNVTLMLPTESVIANAFYKIAFIIG
jgi:hypothetical protein